MMKDRVTMEISEHEKQVIIEYRKAPSDFKYSINILLGIEDRRPQLKVIKGTNDKTSTAP